MGRADPRERAGRRGKERAEWGAEGSESDGWIMAKRNAWLTGVGKQAQGLGGGRKRDREARREPPRTEGPHWGRCGEATASCQEWGSRALTALLPQEHQLEFPQRIPEVSARGHDGAGGAAAASAQRPPRPTPLQPVHGEARGRVGAELSRPLQGPAAEQVWRTRLLSQTGSRRRRLSSESPSTERGPRLGKEGGRCRKQPGVCSGVPRLELFPSQHRAPRLRRGWRSRSRRRVWDLSHAAFQLHSCRHRSPTC